MQQQLEPTTAIRESAALRDKIEKRRDELASKWNTSRWDQRIQTDPLIVEYSTRASELDELVRQTRRAFSQPWSSRPDVEAIGKEYKQNPTKDNLEKYYQAFVSNMRLPAEQDQYANRISAEDTYTTREGKNVEEWTHAYVGSLLVPKADPLGRFILADQYSHPKLRGAGAHVTVLSGSSKIVVLCETHPDDEIPPRAGYLRMHSMTPGGARFSGFSLGTTGYLGTVLAAKLFKDMNGIFSWDGGAGRTGQGRKLWKGLVDSGLAYESSDVDNSDFEGDEEEYEETHRVCVDLTEQQRDRLSEQYASDRGDTGYPGDELCGNLTFSYTDRDQGDTERQYMDFDEVVSQPFYVFVPSGTSEGLLHTGLRPSWAPETNFDIDPMTIDVTSKKLERFFSSDDENPLPLVKNETTQDMLTNSFHGDSGFLVLTIAEALARSGAQDKAATYLNRVDVATLVANNPRLLEILGQQRLPGIAGLPRDMQRSVLGAIAEARAGVKIDWSSENPLRLKTLSAAQKKRLAKFSDLD